MSICETCFIIPQYLTPIGHLSTQEGFEIQESDSLDQSKAVRIRRGKLPSIPKAEHFGLVSFDLFRSAHSILWLVMNKSSCKAYQRKNHHAKHINGNVSSKIKFERSRMKARKSSMASKKVIHSSDQPLLDPLKHDWLNGLSEFVIYLKGGL